MNDPHPTRQRQPWAKTVVRQAETSRAPPCTGDGDPSKAMAVANLAKQIINVAKVEMDSHRTVLQQQEQGNAMKLGSMELGSASSADAGSMAQ